MCADFLPGCTPEQTEAFFGPIQAFFAEGEDGKLLRFTQRGGDAGPASLAGSKRIGVDFDRWDHRVSPPPPSATPNPTGSVDGVSAPCPSGPADFAITAPNRILKKSGAPIQITAADAPGCSGGSFAWTTASTKITLTNANSATVTVQGLAQVSASRDAEVITVTRTQAGVDPVTKTVNVTVAEVKFSKATTQRYGYDDFDTAADPADDHVSVQKNDHTFVHVDITGGALGDDFDFVCDDITTCTAVAPGANASFDLRLNAGNKNKAETPLHAKVKSPLTRVLRVHRDQRLCRESSAESSSPRSTTAQAPEAHCTTPRWIPRHTPPP